jgi:Tfp pilus assembly protein PilN
MPDTNLIPVEQLRRRRRRSRLRLWCFLGGLYATAVILASTAAYIWCDRKDGTLARQLDATEQLLQKYGADAQDLSSQLQKARDALEVSHSLDRQPDWSKLFVLLGAELGEGIVLHRVEFEALGEDGAEVTDRPAKEPLPEKEYRIKLSGLGRTQYTVSQLLLRLENLGIFDSVRLASTRRQALLNRTAVGFSVECSIR